ncbi:MAG: hypothetical protein AB1454_02615 [Candidatus Auribacterota bacterium]
MCADPGGSVVDALWALRVSMVIHNMAVKEIPMSVAAPFAPMM